MRTFGIISEGPSDRVVIQNILVGYFNNPDLSLEPLQPSTDITDIKDIRHHGGWMNVFEYCKSDFIIGALEQNDYIIIQVDTDSCEEQNFDISRRNENGETRTPAEMIVKVVEKFEQLFLSCHAGSYEFFKDRLLFAVCVEEIECWLLPLYHDDKTKEATYGCIRKLNPKIQEQFGVFIDKDNKSFALPHYRKFSRPFIKRRKIDEVYSNNISLKVFLDALSKVKMN